MRYSRPCSICVGALILLYCAVPLLAQNDSKSEKPITAGMNGVSLPVCTYTPTSPLTKEAKAAEFHGEVSIVAAVELDGRITRIRVIWSAGLGLDESAINTLKKWKCKPSLKDGKPVVADTTFQFRFDAN